MLNSLLFNGGGEMQWTSLATLLFALAFLTVGILRLVEFRNIGFSKKALLILSALHVLGCLAFFSAFIFGVLNFQEDQRMGMFICFVLAMILLAPGQFLMSMKRKDLLKKSSHGSKSQDSTNGIN